MKTLELHCGCGRNRQFRAADLDAILDAIDVSGWVDFEDCEGLYPKPGHALANCPACVREAENRDCDPQDEEE